MSTIAVSRSKTMKDIQIDAYFEGDFKTLDKIEGAIDIVIAALVLGIVKEIEEDATDVDLLDKMRKFRKQVSNGLLDTFTQSLAVFDIWFSGVNEKEKEIFSNTITKSISRFHLSLNDPNVKTLLIENMPISVAEYVRKNWSFRLGVPILNNSGSLELSFSYLSFLVTVGLADYPYYSDCIKESINYLKSWISIKTPNNPNSNTSETFPMFPEAYIPWLQQYSEIDIEFKQGEKQVKMHFKK